jgi:arsenate reductase (thioredoxin)
MFILGLNGSPRKKGNTRFLLSSFLKEAEDSGAVTDIINVAEKNIAPCSGCGACDKNGLCIIDDDMTREIYSLLAQADIIIAATPIYFYSATAQFKALIDRTQALWNRQYKLRIKHPGAGSRQGFLLALGATKGKNLFQGIELTAKYFFDAVGADFMGCLTYRHIEAPGDMAKHSTVLNDVKKEAKRLLTPLINRKKILFICRENACRSQIAAAFTEYFAGDKIEAISGGSKPADDINPVMVEVMREKGIDVEFRKPKSIPEAVSGGRPNLLITMGCEDECSLIPGVPVQEWNLPDPANRSDDFMRNVRDEIEKRVIELTGS